MNAASEVKELPDDLRAPLHGLQADLDWIFGRMDEGEEVRGMLKDSIRSRLSQIEEAAYRLNGPLAKPMAYHDALSKADLEYSAYSSAGVNIFGDRKSIDTAHRAFHSHSQIGHLQTNLRHWREECGKLQARLKESRTVADWMIQHSYATGHGDTVEDMLVELEAQAVYRGASQHARGLNDDMVTRAMAHVPGCDHDEMVSALEAALGLPSSAP